MTSSSAPQSKSSLLSPQGKQVVLTAMNIAYDPQGVEMIRTALENTKNEQAIAPTVAMLATTLFHKMGEKVASLPEEEMWGKNGVVHSTLDSIFEIAKVLGYKAPRSDLRVAYEIVEDQMGSQAQGSGAPQEQADPMMQQEAQMSPMGGAMPQEMGPPQGGFPAAQMGGM
jgi:hypothetical protein